MRTSTRKTISAALAAIVAAMTLAHYTSPARAQRIGDKVAALLNPAQERTYVLYLRARAQHDRELDAYWSAVDERRQQRSKKRAAGQPYTPDDFVQVQPPIYRGPALPPSIEKIIAAATPPAPPSEGLPALADFLAHAKRQYGFLPRRGSETDFKRKYAIESLRLGLSKDQVVRVYALETGGRGTYDMQAGIDPQTKKGRHISSALGYAQLLAANSVNELVKHGNAFYTRLEGMSRSRNVSSARASELRRKMVALRRMIRAARSVPNRWSAHVAFSRTPKGLGIHALNLDADIGPWLQTIKLKGVREVAEKAGRPNLTGAEIELMNLAGPRTGLEMMDPVGARMPTTNFFARAAYYRNTIVRNKSSADLLQALQDRMNVNLKQAGSIAFAKAFDDVRGTTRTTRR
ncbi:MAG: hypothetical protein R3D67_21810 [Hyphomicrobiaceae bacterium]